MSHSQTQEEYERIFLRLDVIAEMSDEDMEDYETRLLNEFDGRGLPRRKLANSGVTAEVSPTPVSRDSSEDVETNDATHAERLPDQNIRPETCSNPDTQTRGANRTDTSSPRILVCPPQARSYAASFDKNPRKRPLQLEDADHPGQVKRRREFTPPTAALTLGMEHISQGTSSRKTNAVSNDGDQIPFVPHATPQKYEAKTSSIQQHTRTGQRIKVLSKTQEVESPANANETATSAITTPSTTPLADFLGIIASNSTHGNSAKAAAAQDRQARKAEKLRKEAEERARKKEEAEEKLMTPTEYARKVQTKFTALLEKTEKLPVEKAEKILFLKGKCIFYIGGDRNRITASSRNRMDFIRKKGGTVAPVYDPNTVTHIVTEPVIRPATALRFLGLKSLQEIPDHIPTVHWSWVISGNNGKLGMELLHAAFASRIDACPSKAPGLMLGKVIGKGTEPSIAGPPTIMESERSVIEDFTMATDRIPSVMRNQRLIGNNAQASSSKTKLPSLQLISSDPLAEFYDQAKKDKELEWYQNTTESEQDLPSPDSVTLPKSGKSRQVFACDQKGINNKTCVNQLIIDKLEELKKIHETRISEEDRWRVFSYGKAIGSIRKYPKKIKSYEEAKAIRGVGEKTALKIQEIINTGELRRIQYERTEDVQVISLFKGIYGVGPHIAYKWYQSGCRTLDDVRSRKGGIVVSPIQEIGIKFYDDINSRMPRAEAAEIFNNIRKIALRLDNKLFIEIMGSYRRGKEDCGDIDILLTRPVDDGKTHAGIIRRLLKELHFRNILTEDLALPDDCDALEATYRGLCRKDASSSRRRIDILLVPWKNRGAALLYYTGDDIFNRAIRYKASKMGYSLNQRGLSTNVIRDVHDRSRKLSKGTIIASETEEEIFRILDVPWQEPHERVRS